MTTVIIQKLEHITQCILTNGQYIVPLRLLGYVSSRIDESVAELIKPNHAMASCSDDDFHPDYIRTYTPKLYSCIVKLNLLTHEAIFQKCALPFVLPENLTDIIIPNDRLLQDKWIQKCTCLNHLSIPKNKFISIKSLFRIDTLQYVDLRYNHNIKPIQMLRKGWLRHHLSHYDRYNVWVKPKTKLFADIKELASF